MSECFNVVAKIFGRAFFDNRNNLCVQIIPALADQRTIRNFGGESMLECILQFRKEIGFINKLSGLEMGQILKKRVLGQLRYSLEQIKRESYHDYSGSLKRVFLFVR